MNISTSLSIPKAKLAAYDLRRKMLSRSEYFTLCLDYCADIPFATMMDKVKLQEKPKKKRRSRRQQSAKAVTPLVPFKGTVKQAVPSGTEEQNKSGTVKQALPDYPPGI